MIARAWDDRAGIAAADRYALVLIAGAVGSGAATVACVIASSSRGLAFALVAAQTFGLGWLARLAYAPARHWATATFVTAASWGPLYLIPCWVYAIDPSLLETNAPPAQAIALVDISLFALIGGLLVARARAPDPPSSARVAVAEVHEPSRRALVVWGAVGLLSLAALMALNGGPVAYVTQQNKSAQLNHGLTYLIWGVLFLRFAPLTAVTARWSRGLKAPWPLLAYLLAGCGIVAVTGARLFIAVALVQVLLVFALTRRMPRLRTVLVPAVLIGFVLVFGLGALKRSQAYNQLHPRHTLSYPTYLVKVAPHDALRAYVNNYVDGVRLISLAREVVPVQADYEYGKVLLRFLLRPIPSQIRPNVSESPAIHATFEPPGGYSYAVPLQATAYLEFGIPGIIVVFVLVGALLAGVDRRLARAQHQSLATLLPLIALAVQIPILLRSGIPNGLVFLLIDVIGMWVAALTVAGGPGSLRQRALQSIGRAPA